MVPLVSLCTHCTVKLPMPLIRVTAQTSEKAVSSGLQCISSGGCIENRKDSAPANAAVTVAEWDSGNKANHY